MRRLIFPLVVLMVLGCKGGNRLIVGEIEGPSSVEEESSAQYRVTASGDTGITYLWAVDPASAGSFSGQGSPAIAFRPSAVPGDATVQIRAVVDSDHDGPVMRTREITIGDNPQVAWTVTWGGPGEDAANDIATDDRGDIYVTGGFQDTVDFDPGPGVVEHIAAGGGAFLSKFDPNGQLQWVRTWGGTGNCAAVDGSGCIYVTGVFSGVVDFDPGPGSVMYASNGESDVFLSRFDASGEFQWVRAWGGVGRDSGYGVAADRLGNVYATGSFRGAVDFDPGPGTDYYDSGSCTSTFLSKFSSDGGFERVLVWGYPGSAIAFDVATDLSGDAYVVGAFDGYYGHGCAGPVDFDPGPGVEERSSGGGLDAFLSKFNSSGEFQWVADWGGTLTHITPSHWIYHDDSGNSIAVDGFGRLYVTGYFSGKRVDFDPGPGEDLHSSIPRWVVSYAPQQFSDTVPTKDVFVSVFDSDGEFLWAQDWGGKEQDTGKDVAVDDSGNVYVVGVDPSGFLRVLDSSGGFLCTRAWDADPRGVVVDELGGAYVVGSFEGTVTFETGNGANEHTSSGGTDAFLMRFLPCN